MTTSESFQALRRANPRTRAGFAQSVEAAGDAVRATVGTPCAAQPAPCRAAASRGLSRPARRSRSRPPWPRSRRVARRRPGVENATAAVERAATVTAASAERSGTAVVRITHDGELWAGSTIRWNGRDLAVARDAPRGRAGSRAELRVVDGTLYGADPGDGGWVVLGSPESIDPDSGTTPDEYLAAVREDIGGVTLRRITGGMTGLTTRTLDDGSTVYSGTVPAGLIARETGFKEGRSIRVLPFGYVAHDEAADPAAPLDVAVTVGADGIVREIAVTWGAAPRRGRTRSRTAGSARRRRRSRPRTRARCWS